MAESLHGLGVKTTYYRWLNANSMLNWIVHNSFGAQKLHIIGGHRINVCGIRIYGIDF